MADSDRISLMLDSMIRAVDEGFSYDGIVSVPETGLEEIEHRPGLVGLLHDGLDLVRRKAARVFKKSDLKGSERSRRSQDQELKADSNPRDSGISHSTDPKLSPPPRNPALDVHSEQDLPEADDGSPQASLVDEEPGSGDDQASGIAKKGLSDKGDGGKQPRKKREEEGSSAMDNAARQPRKKREGGSPDDTRKLPRKKLDEEHSTVNTDTERQPRKKHDEEWWALSSGPRYKLG